MFFKSKKGADASAAAALIAIIGGLIVLYILFIPPEERADILDLEEENGYITNGKGDYNLLLSETPNRLLPSEDKEFEVSLSAVNIRVGEEGIELKKADSLYVRRSLFSGRKSNISFEVIDLKNTKSSLLNFIVAEGKGRLIVKLNEKEIFNQEITSGNIDPVDIKDRLIEGTNILEFSVSSPGASFWRTNEYSLEDILVTADVLRREAQVSIQTFVIDARERDNLKKVKIHFLPECDETTAGPLSILINNYELYSAVPDCGVPNRPIEFLPERLVAGENRLKFETKKGWYLIDNIRISSELREVVVPIFYFEIDDEEFKEIKEEEANVTLYMKFADDEERKIADILINNHALRLDQTELEYNETITDLVEKGNNALKIKPDEILDVVKLEVRLES